MRKLTFALLGAAGLVVMSGPAGATDLPAAPPPPLAPAFVPEPDNTWTGFHIGVHAGYAWTNDDAKNGDFFDIDIDGDGRNDGFEGYLAGGQFGYNHQIGNVVLGVEADLAWANLEGESRLDYVAGGNDETATLKAESDWLATVRGRAGYAFDRFMLYATGGVAFTNLEVSYRDTFTMGGSTATESSTLTGWTVGAGVEGMITPNLTARLEYLYVNFGDAEFDFKRGESTLSSEQDFDAHIIRGGLNYKFKLD